MPNGTNSNEVQSPPVNFILGDEPEITVEGPPEDFSKGTSFFLIFFFLNLRAFSKKEI